MIALLWHKMRKGERLPSIPQICGIFQMAPATVRSALALLEKEGYIQVDARRAAQVIYQASPSRFRENAAKYFVPREAGILDLAQSGLLLFEPLWEEGLRRWGERMENASGRHPKTIPGGGLHAGLVLPFGPRYLS
jgi:DNA-binding transcriptional MocR family regulator